MKKALLILFFLVFLSSCKDDQLTHQETVFKYIDARNATNYNQLRLILNESIVITAGDYVMKYDHKSFYKKQFQWDSVFKSSYQQRISFNSGKISKFEDLQSIGTDWEVWEKEKEALVGWVKINHPELDGFVVDMSLNGAIDYLNSIQLYTDDKNDL